MNVDLQISELPPSSYAVAAKARAMGFTPWSELRAYSTDEFPDLQSKILKTLEGERENLNLVV
ncbi:hypothetical protein [Rhizobium leguminosarum]|jgi:hypothetical protein|uniref:hypothetical protein n=1 Tax=Rhizobium leguminosarum TaxID=384 RepID=UPI0015F8A5F7|nr:hypothetical protein [Rhizobium leguminosarum]MBA8836479.1 hypothetical protein [Rhizobium leguminosarum]